MRPLNDITAEIIGVAMRIHTTLGPGVMESVYLMILDRDLRRRGLRVERQKPVSFEFEGMVFKDAFKADLIVERVVVVEVKAVSQLAPVHARQLLTYLRLLDCPVGLLINFGARHLRDGINRVANGTLVHTGDTADTERVHTEDAEDGWLTRRTRR